MSGRLSYMMGYTEKGSSCLGQSSIASVHRTQDTHTMILLILLIPLYRTCDILRTFPPFVYHAVLTTHTPTIIDAFHRSGCFPLPYSTTDTSTQVAISGSTCTITVQDQSPNQSSNSSALSPLSSAVGLYSTVIYRTSRSMRHLATCLQNTHKTALLMV